MDEMKVIDAFKDYLRARRYHVVKTITMQFSNESILTEKES
jgi:hypothetical protein